MRNLLRHTWHLPRNAIALLITGYQHTLSPDHGPMKRLHTYGYCRHEPTCSEYSKDMILRQGVAIGGMKAFWRILSCNPWSPLSESKLKKMASQQ
jgi:putative component of membrane protein insertase Oxa1/YidC/SpoIIIJ protein YidD